MSVDQIAVLARELSAADKLRLIQILSTQMLESAPPQGTRPQRLFGALEHLGPAPSGEEIDEVQREMWANFPRQDV